MENFNAMIDTPENRVKALLSAETGRESLSPQAAAASHTAVWVEDGYVFCSGQWTGQAPEGELNQIDILESCTLTGYNPASGGPGWVVTTGRDAMSEFYRLAGQEQMHRAGNRLEEDYRDADTGIRVCNGYLLQ